MGVEFKDKIMLHGIREVKCLWEVGEVGRQEWWKGNKVARWERQEESGEVGRWEVPGFFQGLETQGDSKILSFCF